MRLITHNMLSCHKRSCNQNQFPLLIENVEVERREVEYNPSFLANFVPRLDWKALREASAQLGLESSAKLPTVMPENVADGDEELLRSLHDILMETHIKNGELKCQNCCRVYPIKDGIANMLLNEEEV
eukprot:Partr_v1_DN27830_c2_g1_i2_m23285 putative tRNA methyltransferase 11-2 homolog